MNQARKHPFGNHQIPDPPSARADVKLVCAWCNREIREGPNQRRSHGICEECKVGFLDEFELARRERHHFVPFHDGKCRGPYDFIGEQLFAGFVLFIVIFLVVMAAEGLHYLTGGKVPRLINWAPESQTSFREEAEPAPATASASLNR